jgi:hypothetical protein
MNEVRITDHARTRIAERFGLKKPEAQLELAELLVRDGTYIGISSDNVAGHYLRHERGFVLVEYTGSSIIVVSVFPPDWTCEHSPYWGGYYMRTHRPQTETIAQRLATRFKVSRR